MTLAAVVVRKVHFVVAKDIDEHLQMG